MIIKSYETKNINLRNFKTILIYGENDGLKNEILKKNLLDNFSGEIKKYDEKDVLKIYENVISELLNKSFFENEKIIIISRVSEKILKFIKEIEDKNISDISIVIIADRLEKKSRLRQIFEKSKDFACIPVYQDDTKTLRVIAENFFKLETILVSPEIINLIVDKCNGDRGYLVSELDKIKTYLDTQNKISTEEITKLTNLSENYSVSELVDNCLSKNRSRTVKILNENEFTTEDTILIIRTLLSKTKRILNLRKNLDLNKSIDTAINNFRPPIFWKDKDIIKKQISKWETSNLIKLIIRINDIELLVKKESYNAIKIVFDFLLENCRETNN